jgi:hypothetical protein
MDNARRHPEAEARKRHQAFVDFMIPIVKGCSTELAQELTSLGVQVHGGMGFIEESGAAQHYRDARITTIYEGTTGIQANDLIGRKTARDGGRAARAVVAEMKKAAELCRGSDELAVIGARLASAAGTLDEAVQWVASTFATDPDAVHAGAVPYLMLWGTVAGGWQMARAARVAADKLAAGTVDSAFYRAKIATARFYADYLLTQADGLKQRAMTAGPGVMALAAEEI